MFIKAEQIPTDPADLLKAMEAHGLLLILHFRYGERGVKDLYCCYIPSVI